MFQGMAFPTLSEQKPDLHLNENARTIRVTNENYLAAPGLRKVETVFLGHVELPPVSTRPFSKQELGKEEEMVDTEVPMLQLGDMPDIGTVLLRSIWSNDGKWQVGTDVTVIGEWDESDDPKDFVPQTELDSTKKALDAANAEIAKLKADADAKAKAEAEAAKKAKADADAKAKADEGAAKAK